MRTGDKVIFKQAFWTGRPEDRARTVFVVQSLLGEDTLPARALRVSLKRRDGELQHGVVAERLEPAR